MALDNSKYLIKDELFLSKLVETLTTENDELKHACCFTLKNMLFQSASDAREVVLRHLSFSKIMGLLAEEEKEERLKLSQAEVLVKEQALMMLRSLLHPSSADIAAVLTGCPSLLDNLLNFLASPHEPLVVQSLYVLSSIGSGSTQ